MNHPKQIKQLCRWLYLQRDIIIMFVVGGLLPILPAVDWPWLRIPVGVIAVLFAPGYVLLAALADDEAVLERTARLALSFGLSIAILPLLALVLDHKPGGLLPERIVGMLGLWITGWAVFAALRRSSQTAARLASKQPIRLSWRWLLQGFAGAVGCVVLGCGIMILVRSLTPAPMTVFYVLGSTGKAEAYPQMLTPAQPLAVTVGLTNGDAQPQEYYIVLQTATAQRVLVAPFRVASRADWEQPIQISVDQLKAGTALDLLLFKSGAPEPIRQLRLWLRAAPEARSVVDKR